jgi:hypothetical protein
MSKIFPQSGSWNFLPADDFDSVSDIGVQSSLRLRRGQVVLEYVLLLSLGLIIGAIIMRQLVGSSSEPKGVRKAWVCLIKTIGQDQPGKTETTNKPSDCQ